MPYHEAVVNLAVSGYGDKSECLSDVRFLGQQ